MNFVKKLNVVMKPLIVVIGATGCGKSKLGIALAQRYNGEIINADAMQIYKGLDIVTNKVTKEEQQLVPHHLLGFVSPLKRFIITDFAARALPLIDDLISNGKMPIIVGGTNYYIESLLWKVLVANDTVDETFILDKEAERLQSYTAANLNVQSSSDTDESVESNSRTVQNVESSEADDSSNADDVLKMLITPDTVAHLSSNTLHEALRKVDPKMASRYHPNDKRKITRSLQIYQQEKRKHSEILEEQRALSGGCSLGGPLRYNSAVVFWLQCDQKVLNERLDSRVDAMIEQGLINELLNFHAEYNKHRLSLNILPDYTHGIFQSIGFKEFHDYLILSEEQRNSEYGKKLFAEGLEQMKLVTRRYSRSQIKWIKKRILRGDREVPPVFALDATDISQWEDRVLNSAIDIIDSFMNGSPLKVAPLPVDEDYVNVRDSFYCEECGKTMTSSIVWEKHVKSRKHQKMKKRRHLALQNLAETLVKFENELKEQA